jgi:hypothetical protein
METPAKEESRSVVTRHAQLLCTKFLQLVAHANFLPHPFQTISSSGEIPASLQATDTSAHPSS